LPGTDLNPPRPSTETSPGNRRADLRLTVNAPVAITNRNAPCGTITEKTTIEDVGDNGCRFSMREPVQVGDTILIQLLSEDGAAPLDAPAKLFRVIWVKRGEEKSGVGVRFCEAEK
jgi:hypothetical protein